MEKEKRQSMRVRISKWSGVHAWRAPVREDEVLALLDDYERLAFELEAAKQREEVVSGLARNRSKWLDAYRDVTDAETHERAHAVFYGTTQ